MARTQATAKPTSALEREAEVREQDGDLKGTRKDDTGRLLYWARRPFGYGGVDLDRGQMVALAGQVNDKKLDRLGYVVPLMHTDQLFPCRYCGAQFVDLSTLNAHGAKRHQDKELKPNVPFSARGATVDETAGETQRFEREQTRLDQDAPLNYDKTAASRGLTT